MCKKKSCEECKGLKYGIDIEEVASIIVKEREDFGDFEEWGDVEERVSRGQGNYNFTPRKAINMLNKQRVLCISWAEEEAAVSRAGNLNQVFNYVLGYGSSSQLQLDQWDLLKARAACRTLRDKENTQESRPHREDIGRGATTHWQENRQQYY